MFKKILYIVCFLLIPTVSYAGTIILEDPPVKYFSDKQGVKLETIKEIIIDAIDRSSYPQHIWTVDSEKSNEVIARLNVRHHVLRMRISFDTHKITIKYLDSVNLSYSENSAGMRRIHEKYAVWTNFLLSKIEFVTKKTAKMSLVNESPIKQVVVTKSGDVAKPYKVVFSAYGDVNSYARESGIYNDKAMSNAMAGVILDSLMKAKPANVAIEKINWDKQIYNYVIKHDKKIPIDICIQYHADVFLTAFLEQYDAGTAGLRDLVYQIYTCKTEDVVKEKYDTRPSFDEKFAYHFDIIKSLKKFVLRFNLFQK